MSRAGLPAPVPATRAFVDGARATAGAFAQAFNGGRACAGAGVRFTVDARSRVSAGAPVAPPVAARARCCGRLVARAVVLPFLPGYPVTCCATGWSLVARAAVLAFLLLAAGCATPRVSVPTDPLSADEHVRLGAVYEREGRTDLAAREYEAALRQERWHPAAHLGLGNLAVARGDLREAERRYRAALARDPNLADALNNLAWVYLLKGGRAEEAVALAKRALEAQPARAAYYGDTLGLALTRAGRPAEGLAALRRALAAVPAEDTALRAEVLGHLAETYRALGRKAEAQAAEAEAARLSVKR